MTYRFLGVTGCPTGIAHTFMAAEALENAAKEKGISIKVETHGQRGTENQFTAQEIQEAEVIIIAADKNVDIDRFHGKKVINVSVSKGIKNPEELIERALSGDVPVYKGTGESTASTENNRPDSVNLWHKIYVHLMNGVSHMLPFVVAGGVMVAISFMFGIYSADPESSQYNEIAAIMNTVGGLAMGLMVPVLSAYIAQSIGNRPGLVIGFIVGMIADTNGTGFLGGIVGGFLAGGIILLLNYLLKRLPKSLDGLKAIFLLPVFGIFLGGFSMWYLSVPMEAINQGMMDFLAGFQDSNPLLLGLIVGIMSAFDMGGPVNKAAYVTGTALLAQGNHFFMAGVSAACIVPPLATGFAVLFARRFYSQSETSAGYVNFLLGSTHITEGAIPFAAKRPLTIIPILMVGSSIGAILTYLFQVEVPAPHGGFIVLPVVTHALYWVLAILIGAVVAGLLMAFEQKRHQEKNKQEQTSAQTSKQVGQLLESKQIFLQEKLNSKDDVLHFIADKAVALNIADNANEVYTGLQKREQEGSTGMENGIAIPHVASSSVREAKLIVVRLEQGMDWPALDEQPTTFVISILVPEGNSNEHLDILSNLSRRLVNQDFVDTLKQSQSEQKIKELLIGGIEQ
ncbi:fructose-specific PTS transporter subunit EIIC [Gracilibacillus phocaeensis]|uniref:fructose-specific PTS transporter subunit EIIC n=1 Tax=Gracilibacillus phocaeensis TaxID=2042304 RepID=UPI00102FAD59|nr:fructose-specific PTS transporter subunit EIIC [Gracilibacillus phocaeensis]